MSSEEGPGAMKRIALSIRNNIDGDLHGPYTLPFAPLVNLCAGLEARRPLTEWFSVRSVNQHTSPALNRGRGSHCGGDESRGERVGAASVGQLEPGPPADADDEALRRRRSRKEKERRDKPMLQQVRARRCPFFKPARLCRLC